MGITIPSSLNKGVSVLLVEENPQEREIIRGYLDLAGFDTIEARGFVHALSLCEDAQPKFQIALIDMRYSDGNGGNLIRRILKARPAFAVLGLSQNEYESTQNAGLKRPPDGYIQKPFSKSELQRRIQDVLRRKNPKANTHGQNPV